MPPPIRQHFSGPASNRRQRLRAHDETACPKLRQNGSAQEDINGQAVSIELFLDLRTGPEPCVRWTSYNSSIDLYQGALIAKERYTKRFLESRPLPPGLRHFEA